MCDQQSLRLDSAYGQSDQSICLSVEYYMSVKLLNKHHLEFLRITGGCTGVRVYTCQNAILLEITFATQILDFRRWYTIAIPAFELTKASAKSNRLGGDAFTKKYIISLLTLTIGHGQTRNVAQYPLHHDLCTCKV